VTFRLRAPLFLLLCLAIRAPVGTAESVVPGARAGALIVQAESLWSQAEFPRALDVAQAALRLGEESGDAAIQARSLNLIGNVLDSQGDRAAAAQRHEQALSIARRGALHTLEARILTDIALGSWSRAEYADALARCDEALDIQRSEHDAAGQAHTLNLMGRIAFKQGAYAEAESRYRDALAVLGAGGDKGEIAAALQNLGDIHLDRHACAPAIEEYSRALAVRVEMNDLAGQADIHRTTGACHLFEGAPDLAVASFQRMLSLAEQSGSRSLRAAALYHLGIASSQRGDPAAAITYCEQALDGQQASGDRRAQAWTLHHLAKAYSRSGRPREALASLEQAIAIREGIQDLRGLAGDLQWKGQIEETLGEPDKALASYRRALELAESIQFPYLSTTLGRVGRLYALRGENDKALDYGRRAAAFAREIGNPEMRWDALWRLGDIQRRAGLRDEALRSLREAVGIIEALRADVTPEDESKVGFQESKQSVYADLVSLLMDLGRAEEALETAEKARARAFLDLLERDDRASGSVRRGAGSPPASDGLASTASVPQPEFSALLQGIRMSRTTVIEYFLGEDRFFVWVAGPDGVVHAHTEAVPRREIESQVLALRQGSRPAARRLGSLLLDPIERWLPQSADDLVTVVPHGPLFLVSFASLQDAQQRWWIQRHTIAYSPAISVLAHSARSDTRAARAAAPRLLVVGNPVMPALPGRTEPLPLLPGADAEVRAVGSRFPPGGVTTLRGAEASESAVRDAAARATLIHLATHAVISDEAPLSSLLALAPDDHSDGLWTAREVFSLRLNADLVTLSACDTGLGRVSGDGVIGLSRAFLSAGASSVMVSLWRVADAAAAPEMEEFYRVLAVNGADRAGALRHAQLRTISRLEKGEIRTASGARLAPDPIYWAPFVLIGQARSPAPA